MVPFHLNAQPGDYAPAVLLPGDPQRAQYIAETFFESPRQVNAVRGLLGYTGLYKGKPVSVQTTGMGCPTTAIVAEELVMLGAQRLLRVGTAGGLQHGLQLGDLVIATCATPADATALAYTGREPHAPAADFDLVLAAVRHAERAGLRTRVGGIVSCDVFYNPDPGQVARWARRGLLAVEMESSVLFTLGALRGCRTATLAVIGDQPAESGLRKLDPEELRRAVHRMVEVALETAIGDLTDFSLVPTAPG